MEDTIWLQRPSEEVPWGFRLQGGRDFKQSLTVQKVSFQEEWLNSILSNRDSRGCEISQKLWLKSSVLFVPKRWGVRVCEYMHARAIYKVLTQGRTVQKGGSNPQPHGKSHPAYV